MRETWERPKTTKLYLHPVYSERIVLLHPEMKLTNLSLENFNRHTNQKASGLYFLFGENMEGVDFKTSRFDTPKDGLPIYTVRNTDPENGCDLALTAFCTAAQDPVCCTILKVSNPSDKAVQGHVGILPRSVDQDSELTNLWDTGYSTYLPNEKNWIQQRKYKNIPNGLTCDDTQQRVRVSASDGVTIRWISDEEQPHRFEANDYFRFDYSLAPGEQAEIKAIATHCLDLPLSASVCPCTVEKYWREILSKIKVYPDTEDEERKNLFLASATQCLQMLQIYPNGPRPGAVYPRQGDVGRQMWIWEARYFLNALERIGLSEYTLPAWKTMCEVWQAKEGENKGQFVPNREAWSNFTGAAVEGMSKRLLYTKDREEYLYFKPHIMDGIRYLENMRGTGDPVLAEKHVGRKGFFTLGTGSDWAEQAQHWTFTDCVNAASYHYAVQALTLFQDPDAAVVSAMSQDYDKAIYDYMDEIFTGHENDEAFTCEHMIGIPFEKTWNHCFYTDGEPYLVLTGYLDPKSKRFEQMEAFYRKIGFFRHGLTGRMTNGYGGLPGVYGDVYYTGVPEVCWLYAWTVRGEEDKVRETEEAYLKYNVTTEYVTAERYCSGDPWYVPWSPNASGSARIIEWLLDRHGERKMKKMIKGYHHVAVKASDFEKSLGFYKDLLELKQVAAWGEGDGRAVMLALADDSRIELFAGGHKIEQAESPYIHIAFRVDCPDCIVEKLRKEGYRVKMEPQDVDISGTPGFKARLAFVYGPDGEEIEFFAPKD